MEEEFSVRLTVALMLIKDGKVLMIKRKNTGYMDDMYAFVGGHVEYGETLKEAMIREAKEEANIKLNEDDLKFVCLIRRGGHAKYINFFFMAENYNGTPIINEPDKCSDMQWYDINNIPENTIDSEKRAIYNYNNKILIDEYEF